MDESGINAYLQRQHARSPIGEKIYGAIAGRSFARESFIAAKCKSKILAPFCYTGTCNSLLFNFWLEKIIDT
ncbi:transposase [Neochlamydia sp. S13]|uniref:transposase n=1 Tax=Neochlamydia sp. S13 TaxID=1353976 RepID=UPI0034CF08B5